MTCLARYDEADSDLPCHTAALMSLRRAQAVSPRRLFFTLYLLHARAASLGRIGIQPYRDCTGSAALSGSPTPLPPSSRGHEVDAPPAPKCRTAIVTPLAPEHYKLQVTLRRETHEKLRHAQALARHAVPDGDVGSILDRALTLLIEHLERRRLPVRRRRARARATGTASGRYIPASVRRDVTRAERRNDARGSISRGLLRAVGSSAARSRARRSGRRMAPAPHHAVNSRLERATSNGTWPERMASLNRVTALANWSCPASSRPAFMYVRPRLDLFHQPLRVDANTASFHRRLGESCAWLVCYSLSFLLAVMSSASLLPAGGQAPTPPPASAISCIPPVPGPDWICQDGNWLPLGHPLIRPSGETPPTHHLRRRVGREHLKAAYRLCRDPTGSARMLNGTRWAIRS